jgi:hypothetical protein
LPPPLTKQFLDEVLPLRHVGVTGENLFEIELEDALVCEKRKGPAFVYFFCERIDNGVFSHPFLADDDGIGFVIFDENFLEVVYFAVSAYDVLDVSLV